MVEGMKLHVDSFTLVDQSPVFKEMLEIAPRNKSGKKILALAGQGVNQVAHLLTFLTEPREIEAQNTDLMALANLAQEFQIALLNNKIRIFLENIKEEKAEEQLKYLKLVNMMNFSQIVQFKILAQIGKATTRFSRYRLIKAFYLLDSKTMKLVAQFRLWYLLSSFSNDILDNIQDEMNGILGMRLSRKKGS
uniref:BTB domain-containing protein n=1 Tax=Clytia hemisphaerica TaxID=252671 RepID=A0A7M5XCC1_9CNID